MKVLFWKKRHNFKYGQLITLFKELMKHWISLKAQLFIWKT